MYKNILPRCAGRVSKRPVCLSAIEAKKSQRGDPLNHEDEAWHGFSYNGYQWWPAFFVEKKPQVFPLYPRRVTSTVRCSETLTVATPEMRPVASRFACGMPQRCDVVGDDVEGK